MTNLLFIPVLLLRNLFHTLIRHTYWLYRLSKCRIGEKVSIQFPVIIEGRGNLVFGNGVRLEKRVNLGVGDGGTTNFGTGTLLQEGFFLRVNQQTIVTFGKKCVLGKNTTIYTNTNWQIGDNVTIASNCAIHAREPGKNGELKIGNGSYIGDHTIIDLCDSVKIGCEVAIGPNCTLYTHDHDYRNAEQHAAWKSPVMRKPIVIEDGAWIGSNVTILPGVTIGAKAVVASGAVVTKPVPKETTVAGVPAKILER